MVNLVRKDIVLQKGSLIILIPILLGYLLMDGSFIFAGFIFSTSLILSAFSIDEKPTINILLNSLPYTRKEIVSSKYIGIIVFTFIIALTIFIGNLVIHAEITPWIDLLFIFILVMVFSSMILPFSYKFKSQFLFKGLIVVGVAYFIVITFFIKNLNDRIREFMQFILTQQNLQIYFLITLSVTALYVSSWILSIYIYKKKVF